MIKNGASQFLTPFLHSVMLLCVGTAALSVQAATINFEKLPDNSDPVDDLHLPINYVFQDGRTGLSFGFDTDGDNIADTEAVIEEHGNTDDVVTGDNVCVGYTAQGGNPKDHDLTGTSMVTVMAMGGGGSFGRGRFAMLIKMSLETRFLRLLHILFCSPEVQRRIIASW